MQTTLIIPLPPVKSALFRQAAGYKTSRRSKAYEDWLYEADRHLFGQRARTSRHKGEVSVKYEVGTGASGKVRDLMAFEKTIEHYLTSRGVIANESNIGYCAISWCKTIEKNMLRITVECVDIDKAYKI